MLNVSERVFFKILTIQLNNCFICSTSSNNVHQVFFFFITAEGVTCVDCCALVRLGAVLVAFGNFCTQWWNQVFFFAITIWSIQTIENSLPKIIFGRVVWIALDYFSFFIQLVKYSDKCTAVNFTEVKIGYEPSYVTWCKASIKGKIAFDFCGFNTILLDITVLCWRRFLFSERFNGDRTFWWGWFGWFPKNEETLWKTMKRKKTEWGLFLESIACETLTWRKENVLLFVMLIRFVRYYAQRKPRSWSCFIYCATTCAGRTQIWTNLNFLQNIPLNLNIYSTQQLKVPIDLIDTFIIQFTHTLS